MAVVIKVSYGVDVVDDSDPYIQIVNDAMYALGNGGTPANSVVDMFPPARFLPNWLIRDWPLKFARKWSWAIRRLHDVPFAAAQKELEGGASNKSLAHRLLETYYENQKLGRRQEWSLEDIKGASGAVFIAGSDTTWATLMIFILNMVLHPEIQEKARDQLDKVVGTDRLPTLDDKEKLPFINDIIQETYRCDYPCRGHVLTDVQLSVA